MSDETEYAQRLGQYILDENPYPWPITLAEHFERAAKSSGLGANNDQRRPFRVVTLECQDPKYLEGFFWDIGARKVERIAKAVKIEYECPDGSVYALIVGYAGGGGGM